MAARIPAYPGKLIHCRGHTPGPRQTNVQLDLVQLYATVRDRDHAIRPTNSPDELLKVSVLGQTALYDAALVALQQLPEGGPKKKVVINGSGGGDNVSAATR